MKEITNKRDEEALSENVCYELYSLALSIISPSMRRLELKVTMKDQML